MSESDDYERGYAQGLAAARAFAEAIAALPESVGRERVALVMLRLDLSLQTARALLSAAPPIWPDPTLPYEYPRLDFVEIH